MSFERSAKLGNGTGIRHAFADVLLQEGFKTRVTGDRVVKLRIMAGRVSAHGNQVAITLITR